jgi:transcriptional regulator with XRE-family HTH domain
MATDPEVERLIAQFRHQQQRPARYQRRMAGLLAGRTRVTMPISRSEEESHDDEDPQDRRHQNAPATEDGRLQPGAPRSCERDLSGKFIGEVERGEKSISLDSLTRISEALKVPLHDLARIDQTLPDHANQVQLERLTAIARQHPKKLAKLVAVVRESRRLMTRLSEPEPERLEGLGK